MAWKPCLSIGRVYKLAFVLLHPLVIVSCLEICVVRSNHGATKLLSWYQVVLILEKVLNLRKVHKRPLRILIAIDSFKVCFGRIYDAVILSFTGLCKLEKDNRTLLDDGVDHKCCPHNNKHRAKTETKVELSAANISIRVFDKEAGSRGLTHAFDRIIGF